MKKFALAVAAAGTIAAGAMAFAPSANAAAPQASAQAAAKAATPNTDKLGCYIPAPGHTVELSALIEAIDNTNPVPGVPMMWNCLQ